MSAAAIAEPVRGGRVRIYTRAGHLTLSVERAQAILRGRRRTRDPSAPALAAAIAAAQQGRRP